MTSKYELQRQINDDAVRLEAEEGYAKRGWDLYQEAAENHAIAEKERDTFKKENEHLARSLEHSGEHVNTLARFLDDILVIEPQLKHLLTGGVWDFGRVHRAAEHLRGEDALESVGYTSDCIEIDMSNVIPFPTDPDSTYRGAA